MNIPTVNEKRTFADLLNYAADCIRYYERIATLPNCNDCGMSSKGCMYLPTWGEEVRINCPHWIPEGGGDED